jgi:hypothetical protein
MEKLYSNKLMKTTNNRNHETLIRFLLTNVDADF